MQDKLTENTHYYAEFVAVPTAKDDGVGTYMPVWVVKRTTFDLGSGVPVLAPLYRPLGRVDGQFAICFTLAGQDAPSGDEEAFRWFENSLDVAELVRLCRAAQPCSHEVADRENAVGDFDPHADFRAAMAGLYEMGLVEHERDKDGRVLPGNSGQALWKISDKGKRLSEEGKICFDGTSHSSFGE